MGCSASVPPVADDSASSSGKAPQTRQPARSDIRDIHAVNSAELPYEDHALSLQKKPRQKGLSPSEVNAVSTCVQLTAASLEQDCLIYSCPGSGQMKKRQLQDECALCLSEFCCGDDLRVLRCGHHFHAACVDDWLQNWGSTCPLCCRRVCPSRSECRSAGSQT